MPSSTVVGICNSALAKIGAERISSLAEDNKRARFCNEQYEKIRDEVLSAHPWNFALLRASLAASVTAPTWGYSTQFLLPTNCLRVVGTEYSDTVYKIEGRYILSDDEGPFNILYISQVTDPSYFPPLFAEALSCRLAADLAYAIAQSNTLQSAMMAAYEQMIKRARSADAQEGSAEVIEASDWINSRQ